MYQYVYMYMYVYVYVYVYVYSDWSGLVRKHGGEESKPLYY